MDERRKKLIVVSLIVIAMLGYSLYDFIKISSESEELPNKGHALSSSGDLDNGLLKGKNDEYVIYVSGEVNKPGVFKISSKSRILDAVNMAGGLTVRAAAEKVNMALQITDGMQINVPAKSKPDTEIAVEKHDFGLVNINLAGKDELEKLPGIGPALAQRIIDYRTNNGYFKDIGDIRNVPGIGENKFNQMKDKLAI